MIDLAGKSVFVKTQEEYESVLRMGKMQGFTWARRNNLNPIEIPFPNVLNFYESKIVIVNLYILLAVKILAPKLHHLDSYRA